MKKNPFVPLTVWLVLISSIAFAQTGQLAGKVYDAQKGHPLEGVSIYDRQSGKGTVTDEKGAYNLVLAAGLHNLRISYIGFKTIDTLVDVKHKVVMLNLELQPSSRQLREVKVGAQRVELLKIPCKAHVQFMEFLIASRDALILFPALLL